MRPSRQTAHLLIYKLYGQFQLVISFFFGTLLIGYLYLSVFGQDMARKMIEIIENGGRECRMENTHDEGCCVASIKTISYKTIVTVD